MRAVCSAMFFIIPFYRHVDAVCVCVCVHDQFLSTFSRCRPPHTTVPYIPSRPRLDETYVSILLTQILPCAQALEYRPRFNSKDFFRIADLFFLILNKNILLAV